MLEIDEDRERGQDLQRRFQLAYLLNQIESKRLENFGWNWQAPDWLNMKVRRLTSKHCSSLIANYTRLYYKRYVIGDFRDNQLKRVPFTHTSDWLRGAISLGKNYQKRLEARNK